MSQSDRTGFASWHYQYLAGILGNLLNFAELRFPSSQHPQKMSLAIFALQGYSK